MKPWKVILISTVITLAIGGIYLFSVWKHRQSPGVETQTAQEPAPSQDDVAVVRQLFPAHFEDTLDLQGKPVWMKDGYVIPYFAYKGGQVEFSRRLGVLPALQRMDVKKVVKAAVPEKVDDGVEHGSRQAFVVFALPGSDDLYATPIGYMQGDEEAYYTDILFYYDDPHTIYNYWPRDVWTAIDAHQVKPGMSELEVRLAVGQKMHAEGDTEGNRTVTYEATGKTWTVTFVKNRATDVKSS